MIDLLQAKTHSESFADEFVFDEYRAERFHEDFVLSDPSDSFTKEDPDYQELDSRKYNLYNNPFLDDYSSRRKKLRDFLAF